MAEYIDKELLYQKIVDMEILARDRYLDTPTNSPCYSRYMTQLGERTQFKFLVMDEPVADVVEVVRCRDCINAKEQFEAMYCEVWKLYNTDGKNGFCNYGVRKEDA